MRGGTRIAVVGAGLIGRRHAEAVQAATGVQLACIVDPAPAAQQYAAKLDVDCVPDIAALVDRGGVDGVILSTPNTMHADGALACIGTGLPVLIEKPLTTDLESARMVVSAAEAAAIPIATGHHRRHNPLVARAKSLVDEGALGQMVSVHGTTWFMKPPEYFDVDWRRRKGAGPIYLNLIHDIDLLQYFCGPIDSVHAAESNNVRGHEVEETAVILLRFESGLLGTVNVCDCAVAPWSWELTARENPAYPATGEDCYWIGGTHGSLSLPNLTLWTNPGKRSWWEPISGTRMPFGFMDSLILQAEQFGRVVRREEQPIVSGRDGLAALAVIEAVKSSSTIGETRRVER
ncbi:Gfo/Idh/MocA family oxidoreductase [Devosia sp.]|uniref:Gfo/Idh/MocA family protein n=1 Tax=Devosia sp. TaxID=1871048 RepID=UPI00292E81D7|nr:Gfo/Idh/MocA family oxidoreductase [Devosia sp.]